MRRLARYDLVVVLALLTLPTTAYAQAVRGWVSSTVQMVELRPLGIDSIPFVSVTTDTAGALVFEGQPVACSLGTCTRYEALAKQRTFAATEDISLTAWGFGMEGLSVTTLLRGRARFGGDLIWPRSDDEIDVIMGFAQWVSGTTRVRAGRQELRTGLGFPAFDGAWASFELGDVTLDGYGGR